MTNKCPEKCMACKKKKACIYIGYDSWKKEHIWLCTSCAP